MKHPHTQRRQRRARMRGWCSQALWAWTGSFLKGPLRVKGLGFRVWECWGLGFKVWGLVFKLQGDKSLISLFLQGLGFPSNPLRCTFIPRLLLGLLKFPYLKGTYLACSALLILTHSPEEGLSSGGAKILIKDC